MFKPSDLTWSKTPQRHTVIGLQAWWLQLWAATKGSYIKTIRGTRKYHPEGGNSHTKGHPQYVLTYKWILTYGRRGGNTLRGEEKGGMGDI